MINIINYTFFKVLISICLLGLSSSLLGIFIILKKQSLLGDSISHSVLPGIALVYMYVRNTNEWVLWLGSILASIFCLFLMDIIKKYSKIKSDTILSLILSSFFGLGNVLICYIQNNIEDNKIAVLEKFILGQISLISFQNVVNIGIVSLITLIFVIILWKELKIFIFDEAFAKSAGFNTKIINIILNFLLISVIIISLKLIGIILTSAFLIMPGIIARQFSDKLNWNIFISVFITFLSGLIGSIISNQIKHMPTGPIIIVIMFCFFILSVLFAPKYGILKKYFKTKKYQAKISKFQKLIHFYYKNEYFNFQELETFLFKEKYLIFENNKIIITKKGINMIENLISGNF
jgi:ABC-type Mn2+/Zn2+ transport system permease subunit